MKKIFAMLAAIFFCGAMMISCNKDNKEEVPTFPTKTDMVGTWEGTFSGTTTIGSANENYTIKWTLVLNPEGSTTVGSLKYTASFATMQDINGQVPVTDYYTKQNTDIGRILITGGPNFGLMDEIIDFDMDLTAKTLTGFLDVYTNTDDDVIRLGGETTLHKK